MITKEMRIDEAVKLNPAIKDILSDTGLDFCCGSHRPLEEALNEKNIDIESYIDLLNKKSNSTYKADWSDAINYSKEDLIKYIVEKHHRPEEEMLEKVDSLLNKILKVHYKNHYQDLVNIYSVFLNLKAELSAHFAKEENIVFPMILSQDRSKVEELEDEHERAGNLLKELERLTDNFSYPQDACQTYMFAYDKLKELIDDIHIHIFLENSVLFK